MFDDITLSNFVGVTTALLVLLPSIFWVRSKLNSIHRMAERDLYMHENPEKFGFGTKGFRPVIEENTRAIRELSHYMRWAAEAQSGKKPPPFISGGT